MNKKIITLESNKYELKLDNFEGPLDLLVYLIDKNKMDIYKVNLSEIADQYIDYLRVQEELNLEIASEFLVMASTLLLIKSRGLLPKETEDEAELSEEELIRRILEYKKYKEITRVFRNRLMDGSKRVYRQPEKIVLPKQELDVELTTNDLYEKYKYLINRVEDRKNENAKNIHEIALHETYSVADKVKEIIGELVKKPRFVFNKLFALNKKPKAEVITAFSGVLELSKVNQIYAEQEKLFGDIVITKNENASDSFEFIEEDEK